ncbi:hypothetical protein Pcinc_000434 [Petrolisthes cinctipes]|uniref:Uncharacterized protein n=1 Tax=Petrolisthes cinctipes TaxID=88211 RepID=A0AAE1GS31_PETCI|nr:hypothetical protein Pcinc_000434 [Petrolisthes cinctipes]
MSVFWEELNACLRKIDNGRRVVMMGDMYGKKGGEEVGSIVGKWGVEGVNEKGEYLVDVCAERGLFLANTFFQHKMIHRYTWKRKDERGEQKSLIDYYVAVDERLRDPVM